MYTIVEFIGDDSVECVPRSWIHSDKKRCYWPNYADKRQITRAIKKSLAPDTSAWSTYPVRIRYTAG
jgi:hypothetical protein